MIRSSMSLMVIGVVVTALLAGIDELTRNRIEAHQRRAFIDTLIDVTGDARFANVTRALDPPLVACSVSGTPLHRVFKRTTRGYAGPIQLLLAIDAAGKLTGVRAVEHRETTGIGDVIDVSKSDWIRTFNGLSAASFAADAGVVDAVSGASVTTGSVIDGVRETLADAAATPSRECRFDLPD